MHSTATGYAGGGSGAIASPTYAQVCSGLTDHAEAVRVIFDPARIALADLLRYFWQCHDPTQVDRQGNDVGRCYRSAVFYSSNEQRQVVDATRAAYQRVLHSHGVSRLIVTEVAPLPKAGFYLAESVHQQYLAKPGARPYCSLQPLGIQLLNSELVRGLPCLTVERRRLAPKLPELFWELHAPTHHCAISVLDAPISWPPSRTGSSADDEDLASGPTALSDDSCDPPDDRLQELWPPVAVPNVEAAPRSIVLGSEALMAPKGHGSTATGVQERLRWGCDAQTATRICCFNRRFAEPKGYLATTRWIRGTYSQGSRSVHGTASDLGGSNALGSASAVGGATRDCVSGNASGDVPLPPTLFFDSVSGKSLFRAPIGRSHEAFETESIRHGWPSFRIPEVSVAPLQSVAMDALGDAVAPFASTVRGLALWPVA